MASEDRLEIVKEIRAEQRERQPFINTQFRQAMGSTMLDCGCGRNVPIRFMYQCFYCREWFCQDCAPIHFGKTQEQYELDKIEMRLKHGE